MAEIENLRKKISHKQRSIFDAIWKEHLKTNKWAFCHNIELLFPFEVEEVINQLSVVVRNHDSNAGKDYYQLTFIGILLTSDAPKCEILLIKYFDFLREKFFNDREYNTVHSKRY